MVLRSNFAAFLKAKGSRVCHDMACFDFRRIFGLFKLQESIFFFKKPNIMEGVASPLDGMSREEFFHVVRFLEPKDIWSLACTNSSFFRRILKEESIW